MTILKQLIFFSLVLLPLFAFGQKRFAIDLRVSPDYTYRYIQTSDASAKSLKDFFDAKEEGQTGGHISINVLLKPSSRVNFRIGLQVAQLGYSGKWSTTFNDVGRDNQGNLTTTTTAFQFPVVVNSQTTNYVLLNVPIAARFVFLKGKISPYIELGLMSTYRIGGTTIFSVGQEQLTIQSVYRQSSLFALAALGVQFKVSESLNLLVQPTIQYQIENNVRIRAYNASQHLYSIGAELGVSKTF